MEEEEVSMDELIQYIMDEGKREGKAEGKAEGEKIGEKRGEKKGEKKGQMDVIRWMIDNPNATPEQAMREFGLSEGLMA
ncbi:MAG: hypothetical protein LUE29_05995 [Lachnospiraceae bacterium]|nr:hypothetical protein [Lachnospiraceae bacterium]